MSFWFPSTVSANDPVSAGPAGRYRFETESESAWFVPGDGSAPSLPTNERDASVLNASRVHEGTAEGEKVFEP